MPRPPARDANLALRGAELLGKAADRLAASGWIETGMLVLLLGRAIVSGHRLSRQARVEGRRLRLLAQRRGGEDGTAPATSPPPDGSQRP